MTTLPLLNTVLILTDNELHAKRDRLSLRELGAGNVHVFTSGAQAFEFLEDEIADLILCDYNLADMDGARFIRALAQRPGLKGIPVVMVTMENHRNKVLEAISAGCSGYVLRPYSLETFQRHITMSKQLERFNEIEEMQLKEAQEMVDMGNFDDAIEAFEEIVSMQDEAQKYYDLGLKYLLRQNYGKAIIAFKKAVKINDLFAEAYKGLADAYKGKGDMEQYKSCLQKAAEVFAQFDRLEETKELFIEILKLDTKSPNPFNTLGVRLRKKGDYAGAIHAYSQAVELTPDDENIYFNMAKACFFMGDGDKAQEHLVSALSKNPSFHEARQLYERVSGRKWHMAADPARAAAGSSTGALVDE